MNWKPYFSSKTHDPGVTVLLINRTASTLQAYRKIKCTALYLMVTTPNPAVLTEKVPYAQLKTDSNVINAKLCQPKGVNIKNLWYRWLMIITHFYLSLIFVKFSLIFVEFSNGFSILGISLIWKWKFLKLWVIDWQDDRWLAERNLAPN